LDPAFKELVLTLPAETYIGEQLDSVDPQQVHAVREALRLQLAQSLHEDWLWAFETHRHVGAYAPDAEQSGRRALAGLALNMLCLSGVNEGDEAWPNNALQAFQGASNMTDRFQALTALVQSGSPLAQIALQRFHAMYSAEALVIDKWFALQAGACDRGGDVLPKVRQLLIHPDFEIKNPNRARSLIFSYCNANPAGFHRADASGYVLWAEKVIEIDAFNPQVAARLARALDRWRKLADPYRSAAREAIARVAAKTDLSSDVREVVSRALAE
jgi:aminopeptidase N